MTTLTMHASRILLRDLGPGDEVLVTGLDHDANVAPWLLAAADRGVTVRQAGIDLDTCLVDVDDFAAKLSDRTRVAAFGWASNGAGTVNDVARLTALARAAGALSYVDAVHYGAARADRRRRARVSTSSSAPPTSSSARTSASCTAARELLERHRPYKVRPATDQPPAPGRRARSTWRASPAPRPPSAT